MIVAALVVLLILAAVFLSTPAEPSYRGRPLTYWLAGYDVGFAPRTDAEVPSLSEAEVAIRAIGTNAIPNLLRRLQHHHEGFSYWQFSRKRTFPFFRFARASAISSEFEAIAGFRTLGADAGPAVPLLLEVYNRTSDLRTRSYVLVALANIGPSAEPATPLLLHTLVSTNFLWRECAAHALGEIHANAPVVVPALIPGLRDPEDKVRAASVEALAEFGTAAKSAMPELLALLRDPKRSAVPAFKMLPGVVADIPTIAEMATNALRDIDSDAPAHVRIKDDPGLLFIPP